jgi:pimeloyl-ACP methyl ester carboxylesterase
LEKIQGLLAAGNRGEAVRVAMRESVGASEEQLDAMAGSPGWTRLLAVAPAIPHDWMLWEERFDARRASAMRTRTLMLMGSESPGWLRQGTEAVLAALPAARAVVLPGQGHSAMITAPELLARAVIDFATTSPTQM